MNTADDRLFKQAVNAFKANQFGDAKTLVENYLTANPGHADALNFRGLIAYREKDNATAIDYIEKAVANAPNHVDALLNLGVIHFESGNFQQSLQACFSFFSMIGSYALPEDNVSNVLKIAGLLISRNSALHAKEFDCIKLIGKNLGHVIIKPEAEQLFSTVRQIASALLTAQLSKNVFVQLPYLLGFHLPSGKDWNKKVYLGFVLPTIQDALDKDIIELALIYEALTYSEYIKCEETETHFEDVSSHLTEIFEKSGRAFGEKLTPIKKPPLGEKINIGFFVHQASFLAHIEMMTNVLEGVSQSDNPLLNSTVIVFNGKYDYLDKRLRDAGVNIIYLSDYDKDTGGGTLARLKLTREISQQLNLHAVAWISTSLYMTFAYSMGIAPVQIWWSMKYHTLDSKPIDGYITCGSLEEKKEILGREWRTAFIGIGDWYDATVEEEAKQKRAALNPFSLVLGSFGREEKLSDPAFIDTICTILKRNPQCVFLWTGKTPLPSIENRFVEQGVVDQTRFIGWVNTKVYAQVIDIFVDSFPFPCGFTLYQAMAAEKCVVFYKSPESFQVGANGVILPILEKDPGDNELAKKAQEIFFDENGELFFFSANDTDEYIEMTQRFIDDPELREKSGKINKEFVEGVLSNKEYMGKVYQKHFKETVEEKYKVLGN